MQINISSGKRYDLKRSHIGAHKIGSSKFIYRCFMNELRKCGQFNTSSDVQSIGYLISRVDNTDRQAENKYSKL